jgi:hypothetical protein
MALFARGGFPIFLDLLWEETSSPVLSFCILLKLSKCATFGLLQLRFPNATCTAVSQGSNWPDSVVPLPTGSLVALYLLPALALGCSGASVLRWQQTARLLPLGLLLMVGYLISFSILELAPCVTSLSLARNSAVLFYGINVAFAFTLAAYDLLLIVIMILSLLRQSISQLREIISGMPKTFPPRDVRNIRPQAAQVPGALGKVQRVLHHWGRVAAVAPLRHKVAVASSVLLLLTCTVCVFSVIAFARYEYNKLLRTMSVPPPLSLRRALQQLQTIVDAALPPPPFPSSSAPPFSPGMSTSSSSDSGAAAVVFYTLVHNLLLSFKGPVAAFLDALGASIILSFLLQLVVFKRTFDFIYGDQQRILSCLAAPPEAPLVAHLEPEAGALSSTEFPPAHAGWEEKIGSDGNRDVEANMNAKMMRSTRMPQLGDRSTLLAGRFADGTLDIIGSFQFLDAVFYMGMFAANAMLSYFLNWLLWMVIIFVLRFPPTMPYALVVFFIGPIGVYSLKLLHTAVLALGIVRGNRVLAPRLLIWADLLLTFTLGGVFGVVCTVPRFILAIAHLFARLVVFQQPIVAARLARLDPAFVVYGALMKTTFMPLFDEEPAPDATQTATGGIS